MVRHDCRCSQCLLRPTVDGVEGASLPLWPEKVSGCRCLPYEESMGPCRAQSSYRETVAPLRSEPGLTKNRPLPWPKGGLVRQWIVRNERSKYTYRYLGRYLRYRTDNP